MVKETVSEYIWLATCQSKIYEVPCHQGWGLTPDAAITLPAVPQPRDAGERGDRGVRGPGEARVPSQRGHAPHADQHLHGDSLPSPEGDRG